MEALPRHSEVSEQATGIPRTMPGKQLNNNAATSVCLGATEIILRTLCTVSNKLSIHHDRLVSYTCSYGYSCGATQNADCPSELLRKRVKAVSIYL